MSSHFVKLWVDFVEVLKVQQDFLWLHCKVFLILRILDLFDLKEPSGTSLNQNNLSPKLLETPWFQDLNLIPVASESPLDFYCCSNIEVKWVEYGFLVEPYAFESHLTNVLYFLSDWLRRCFSLLDPLLMMARLYFCIISCVVRGLCFALVITIHLRVESEWGVWVCGLFADNFLLIVIPTHKLNNLLDGPCAVPE